MPRKTKAEIKEKLQRAAKRVRDRNYRFRKMSPERQRVTIARDVIALLEAEKITAKQRVYMEFGGEYVWDDIVNDGRTPLHQLIESSSSCEVCGIGACFVGAVMRADGVRAEDMSSTGDDRFMRNYLGKWFSREQLELIECAFECSINFAINVHYSLARKAEDFGMRYDDPHDRLIAIMRNVIENDGQFTL